MSSSISLSLPRSQLSLAGTGYAAIYIQEFSSNLSDAASTPSLQNIYKKGNRGSKSCRWYWQAFHSRGKSGVVNISGSGGLAFCLWKNSMGLTHKLRCQLLIALLNKTRGKRSGRKPAYTDSSLGQRGMSVPDFALQIAEDAKQNTHPPLSPHISEGKLMCDQLTEVNEPLRVIFVLKNIAKYRKLFFIAGLFQSCTVEHENWTDWFFCGAWRSCSGAGKPEGIQGLLYGQQLSSLSFIFTVHQCVVPSAQWEIPNCSMMENWSLKVSDRLLCTAVN